MKTSWAVDYVVRDSSRTGHAWCVAKAKELMEKTGVPWESYSSHGRIHFTAIWNGVEPIADHDLANQITEQFEANRTELRRHFGELSFYELSRSMRKPIAQVMGVCKWMTRHQVLVANVNRNGNAAWVRLQPDRDRWTI